MNKHLVFLVIFTTIFSLKLAAQPEGIIAFSNYSGDSKFAPKAVINYKYETTKALFDQLVMTRGDFRKTAPELVMNTGRRYMAWTHPSKGEIGLEERAYDACTQFGKDSLNALAILLAHEITHYYENHDWSRHFINNNRELEASTQIGNLEEGIKLETQADYIGGILALTAGYSAYHLLPDLLTRLYEYYGLPEQIPGYPSLSDRLQLSQNTAERLRKLHNVLETANLLTLIEQHETANEYYRFLLNEYQSYEVYNNAAVNAILASLKLMDAADFPYALPLEMDASSRLEQLDTRLPGDPEKRRLALLKTAEQWLQNATKLATQEAVAYLNLGIVYTLKKSWFEAEYQASKAINIAQSNADAKTAGDAKILLGIIAALKGQKEQARSIFQEAQTTSPFLAGLNLTMLNGSLKTDEPPLYTVRGVEKIDGINLDDFLEAPEIDVTTELTSEVLCGKTTFAASQLHMHYANDGDEYAVFQKTALDYDGETRLNLTHGATTKDVIANYGSPDAVLSFRQGSCLRYDKHKLLFIFNESNTLISWIVFRTNL